MKKIVLIMIAMLVILTGCATEKNIAFEATIEVVNEESMIVTTDDEVGFDQASVGLSTANIEGNLSEGKRVKITIEPEVRETYPVQVTAIKVEVIDSDYQKITAEEAKEMMQADKNYIILDVRTLEEYNEGHIKGATLLADNEFKEKAESTLPHKEATILVYCRSGRRSAAAARELINMGYTNVYDFGGIIDWPYEVVKE